MTGIRGWIAPALAVLVAACSPGGDAPAEGNTSQRLSQPARRPSAPARLSQQELAIRIGPRCPETTDVDYRDGANGAADYVVTCGDARFRVTVASDGGTTVAPIRR